MTLGRRLRHGLLRARQTLTDVDNGWQVARGMVTGAEELEFAVGGLRIVCPNAPGARVPVYEIFVEDAYDLDWLCTGLGDAPVALDIGAHIGCFSLALAAARPAARVHAFEPTPSTHAYLARNVEHNALGERIRVHPEAVAAESGRLVMADNGVGSGHNGVLHLGERGAEGIVVASRGIAEAFALAGPRVDLVKMDAEGAEYEIVLESDPQLWSGVRRLVMEYHPMPERSFDQLAERLGAAGLSVVRRIHAPSGLGLAWFSRDPLP